MNDPDYRPLLNDLLPGEEAEPRRAASLEQMLGSVRQRQRQRQRRRLVVMAIAPVLVVLALFVANSLAPVRNPARSTAPLPDAATANLARPAAATTSETTIRLISDDELLGLFPDRPVALIGPPGRQQFVFLDTRR